MVLQTIFASPVVVPKWVESDSNRQSRCLRGRGFTIILPTLTLSEQESNLRGTCLTGKRDCQQSPSENKPASAIRTFMTFCIPDERGVI
jgi:hypothetical protein